MRSEQEIQERLQLRYEKLMSSLAEEFRRESELIEELEWVLDK